MKGNYISAVFVPRSRDEIPIERFYMECHHVMAMISSTAYHTPTVDLNGGYRSNVKRHVRTRSRLSAPASLMTAVGLCLNVAAASAADFTITAPDTTARTLGSGSGQTGTITASGVLTVSGATIAVTITGNNATLNNLGTISTTGTGRVIRDNTGVTNFVVNNGSVTNATALMQAADADVIQMNKPVASVTLNNYGQMISLNASAGGSQAVDFSAITTGANVVNNFATGLMKAFEADAVRPGVNGVVFNAGRIISVTTTGSSSDGIDMQNNSGAQITNDTTGLIEGGRHGITGGAVDATVNFTASITNNAGGRIQGDNGSGINLDGFNARQMVTVVNAGTIVGNGITGDGDGVDVDGLVTINNTGVIRSVNAFSPVASGPAFSEGITVGGGTITNSGTIEGLVAAGNTNALGRGITLAGNDIATGPLAGTREAIYGNAVVNNNAGGLIRGQNDSAIAVDGAASGFTVTINNAAGATIMGGSSTAAAIRTGLDNDTINNSGTINGVSSGKAIDMGAGNNTLNILGGHAFIVGDISGGTGGINTLMINPGSGNQFAYAGAISNFATVTIASGTTVLSGVSTYDGKTTVGPDGTLVLDGVNRLSAASGLDLAGGKLSLVDAAGVNGQTFASFALEANSAIDLGGSSLTFDGLGNVVNDALLTISGFIGASPADYAFRFLGDFASNVAFQELLADVTIDGRAATFRFDGVFTDVSAVPEPSSIMMMLLGLVVIGLFVTRRSGKLQLQ
jgi:PEP-CTERM motif